ncbi:hypothetical protein JCM11491_005258 [Sporobolomyces phaffii]
MDPPTTPQPRSMATLGGLPPELKAQIVRELYLVLLEQAEISDQDWCDEMDDVYGMHALDELVRTQPQDLAALRASGWPHWADYDEEIAEYPVEPGPDEDGWQDEERDPDQQYARRIPTVRELAALRERWRAASEPELASLQRLSLVNREFADLSYPWLWQDLSLEEKSGDRILDFIQHTLPRHARHVRSLAFGHTDAELANRPIGLSRWGHPIPPKETTDLIISTAERLSGILDPGDIAPETRERRARSLLIAEIIRMCPNIERIDCESFQKHEIPDDAYEDDEIVVNEDAVYRIDHALDAVRTHLGPKLTDLTLLVNDDSVTTEADVAHVLEACPNLVRLDLEVFCGYQDPDERKRLHRAVLNLRQLESLDVAAGSFVTDEFVTRVLAYECEDEDDPGRRVGPANPFPRLELLALVECDDLSFESFYALVDRFRATLKVLDLDDTPHANHAAETDKYLGRAFDLPRLETLVVSTAHEPEFLAAFRTCRLVEFSLGFCPAFAYKDVEDFVTLHQETLRKVEVADDAALTDAQVESLEVFCHAKGIRCELLDPESDDDLSAGVGGPGGLDGSDFDDEDEGGWYDEDSEDHDEHEEDDDDEDDLARDRPVRREGEHPDLVAPEDELHPFF